MTIYEKMYAGLDNFNLMGAIRNIYFQEHDPICFDVADQLKRLIIVQYPDRWQDDPMNVIANFVHHPSTTKVEMRELVDQVASLHNKEENNIYDVIRKYLNEGAPLIEAIWKAGEDLKYGGEKIKSIVENITHLIEECFPKRYDPENGAITNFGEHPETTVSDVNRILYLAKCKSKPSPENEFTAFVDGMTTETISEEEEKKIKWREFL